MKTFDQWMADQAEPDDGPVFMLCGCGLTETVQRAALLNGDTRWVCDKEPDDVRVGDHVAGLCCGGPHCVP